MKETDIRARVPADLKKIFLETCKHHDLTGSQVIRKLMKEWIKKNAQAEMNL